MGLRRPSSLIQHTHHKHIRLSSVLDKPARLEYTTYFDYCCEQLHREREYSTDLLLVNLIRIRKIADKVHDTFWGETECVGDKKPFQKIYFLAMGTIRKELDELVDDLPESLSYNGVYTPGYLCLSLTLRARAPAYLRF